MSIMITHQTVFTSPFKILILQYMQQDPPAHLDSPLLIKDPHTAYKCGCGEQFISKDQFREHSLCIHNGQFIIRSTHFLSCLTYLVMPVQNPPEPHPRKKQEPSPQELVEGDEHEPVTQNQFKKNQKIVKEQKKEKEKTVAQLYPNKLKQADEDIEWNGFRLIKNKKIDQSTGYFCGKCLINFSLAEQFIIHCIEICQKLSYPKSSHFITCILDSMQTQEKLMDQIQVLQPIVPKQIPRVPDQHKKREIMIKGLIKYEKNQLQTAPLYCGCCNQVFTLKVAYFRHICNIHQQIVPPSSSHIILRALTSASLTKTKIRNIYISRNDNQISDDPKYHCPCEPETKMTFRKLVQHMMVRHRGISPIYQGRISIINNQLPVNVQPIKNMPKSNEEIGQILLGKSQKKITKKSDPIFAIYSQLRDHRRIPIHCYTCNNFFSKSISFALHISRQHENDKTVSFSHVIFKIRVNKTINNHMFISPQIKWHDNEAIYYCPCQPQNKVTMSQLLQHHIDVHNFVSPIYDFT